MEITANLANQIIDAKRHIVESLNINEVGGSIMCKDFAGKWFELAWFHGSNVTTLSNMEDAKQIYIGLSETNEVTL